MYRVSNGIVELYSITTTAGWNLLMLSQIAKSSESISIDNRSNDETSCLVKIASRDWGPVGSINALIFRTFSSGTLTRRLAYRDASPSIKHPVHPLMY